MAFVLFILLLGVCEYWAFSDSLNYFWGGDDLFWLSQRFASLDSFLQGLLHADAEGWYRPLSNRTIYSLFFPFFGVAPQGYRIVVLLLVFLNSIAALFLFRHLKFKPFAACVAVLFFAVHSANAYTAFDGSYAPELIYTFFYICSFILFLRSSIAASVVCFALSLASKESAVTLPFVIAFYQLVNFRHLSWRTLAPYLGVLGVYVAYIVGFLHVASGHYSFNFGVSLLKNVARAVLWALNLPVGSYTQYRHVGWLGAAFLYAFAACIAVALFYRFTRNSDRQRIVFGCGWFLIAAAPALPIYFYFRPYYLYLPLLGVAMVVGLAMEQIKDSLSQRSAVLAALVVGAILAANVIVIRKGIQNEMQYDPAKGGTSASAYEALTDMRRLHPVIPRGATIYVSNPDDLKTYWDYGKDALFKVFYDDPTLRVLYYSMGDRLPEPGTGNSRIVLEYRNHRLIDASK